ncbi:hypothetical protein ES703_102875 [subsurface metagenome]
MPNGTIAGNASSTSTKDCIPSHSSQLSVAVIFSSEDLKAVSSDIFVISDFSAFVRACCRLNCRSSKPSSLTITSNNSG